MQNEVYRQVKTCLVCGDIAAGTNFNVRTCHSCKAFFRRNAFRIDKLRCSFYNDLCLITKNTRRLCPKCRMQKCFNLGMKKEWIQTPIQKQLIKQGKITKTMIRHYHHLVQEIESQVMENDFAPTASFNCKTSFTLCSSCLPQNEMIQLETDDTGGYGQYKSIPQSPNYDNQLFQVEDQDFITNYLDFYLPV